MGDNLVSDNQGRETMRLARNVGLRRDRYQTALTDGTVQGFLVALRDGLSITFGMTVEYPDWVVEHLTPKLEAPIVCNPGKVWLWLDRRQTLLGGIKPNGYEVYEILKTKGLLKKSLSLGNLKWYEANPDQIPKEFRGNLVYAWASVVRDAEGSLVPALNCDVDQPCVVWNSLDPAWNAGESAGLRAS